MDHLDTLRRLSRALTDPAHAMTDLVAEATALRELLEHCSTLSTAGGMPVNADASVLDSGLAISPVQAALCALQPYRTIAFIKGLHAAIGTVLRAHERVHVLYAGCGPYALLALPQMALYGEQVGFTLIDVHDESLRHARALVDSFGLGDCVDAWVCADATHHRIDPARPPHVIVSETMNAALRSEPQVAIFRALHAQAPAALLVPERVTVHACLLDPARELSPPVPDASVPFTPPQRDRIDLGPIFTLDSEALAAWCALEGDELPAAAVRVPPFGPAQQARLLTKIDVYGGHRLDDYECSLTVPQRLPGRMPVAPGDTLQFSYRLGSSPGLVCARV
ncbi:hypothetical protein IP92_05169 [Pseudoduganella flava]|uniref:Class I SAM-dependent methyltransferase n=1 Tax=Pseudoduganella flava TaxID=871742 RepID=A0A562PEJ1_9BURK|nr:hypothetical protein [Pseudoduganella flava]QGZ38783.1 hypothetical protein GO485_06775 [Pseudoduganella flava]TWI42837.1 hypothetical protein IP92_05169 [Pseudoduganella flava]